MTPEDPDAALRREAGVLARQSVRLAEGSMLVASLITLICVVQLVMWAVDSITPEPYLEIPVALGAGAALALSSLAHRRNHNRWAAAAARYLNMKNFPESR